MNETNRAQFFLKTSPGILIALCLLLLVQYISLADGQHDHEHEKQTSASPLGTDTDHDGDVHEAEKSESSTPESKGHTDSHDEDHDSDALHLRKELIDEFGLLIQTAGPGTFSTFVETPGAVAANEDTLSHISARFPGIVKQVKKKIGDSVKVGEALAVIESNESLTPYTIRSLINGTVIAKHATLGELLKEDDVAYTVADLSSVWVNLSIYQANIPSVRNGQSVVISQGHGQKEAVGTLSYVSPVVDEDTRTATARVVLPNTDGVWMPGLFVTGKIAIKEKQSALVIPATAVHSIEGRPSVFVVDNKVFKPVAIKILEQNDRQVVVQSGLQAGDRYVSENGFALKAELAKASFGDGHNH